MIIIKIMAWLFLGLIAIGFIAIIGVLLAWLRELVVSEKEDEGKGREDEIDHE